MITVIGSYNQDLFFAPEVFPQAGETVLGQLRLAPGGKGLNQAVAASRMGAQVNMIGALGADTFADAARSLVVAESISGLWQACEDIPTGSACILLEQDGSNRIVVAPGANAMLSKTHVDQCRTELESSRVILAQGEVNPRAVNHAFTIGRRATTVLNPAPVGGWMLPMLGEVDLVTPNETELAALLGLLGKPVEAATLAEMSVPELSSVCAMLGPPRAVVTLGAAGCFVFDTVTNTGQADAYFVEPPVPPGPVIDTTGAGDCFNGTLAAGLDAGLNLKRAICRAVQAATISVTRFGAAPSMPRLAELGV